MTAAEQDEKEMTLLSTPATTRGVNERFTGAVWVDTITNGSGPCAATLAAVRFSPGARTAWHSHEHGQTLHVTDGAGIVQSRDGQTIVMRPGETVVTPPGVWHWHGAFPGSFMSHLALSVAGGTVEWGEQVGVHEYTAAVESGEDKRGNR